MRITRKKEKKKFSLTKSFPKNRKPNFTFCDGKKNKKNQKKEKV